MEMEDFMAQARVLQDKVSAAQALLDKTIVRGIAANGDVIVSMTGKYDVAGGKINPSLFAGDAAAATAAIADAFRDAKAKADATIDRIMGDATAGMPLPE